MTAKRLPTAKERSAKENLDRFIAQQKKLTAERGQHWDAPGWPYVGKNSRVKRNTTVWFDVVKSRSSTHRGESPFPPNFFDYVRAFVSKCISDSGGGVDRVALNRIVDALGYLCRAAGSKINVADLLAAHFTEAEKLIDKERTGHGRGNTAGVLEMIASTIYGKRLTVVIFQWKKTIRFEEGAGARRAKVGDDFEEIRRAKLPTNDVIAALGHLSSRTDLPIRDLVCMRIIDLIVLGGFRITEVLSLPRDTLVETPELDEHGEAVLDSNGAPEVDVNLRYWPAKGGHTVTGMKTFPRQYRSIVRRAIAELLRVTQPFAELAQYMRSNPGRTRLGEPWDSMPDDTRIDLMDVARLLRVAAANRGAAECVVKQQARHALKALGVPIHALPHPTRKKNGLPEYVLKADLVRGLVLKSNHERNLLPDGVGNLYLDGALIVVPVKFFRTKAEDGIVFFNVMNVDYGKIRDFLAGRHDGMQKSVFERYGLKGSDGKPLKANSHQFRHLMDTMMAEGGLGEMERALYAGRAKITHNSSYNHVSGRKMARDVLDKLEKGQVIGPAADQVKRINDPVRRDNFKTATFGAAALFTELGLCIHDWSVSPCPHHEEHVHCSEHLICKGRADHRAEAERQLEEHRWLVEMARAERDQETYGADAWLERHERTCQRLETIISIHRSNLIPDGWLVQLTVDGEVVLTEDVEKTLEAE
ncbi:hypothetical protein HL658_12535 [Azospirillum sp. RWY-5-1]|uniref:Integrase n=1 Tax=Azospirillum oleiclasticum TaxID=2735135 RepID=A0ABX2TBB8_9PROT|nr:hypothetical protein [Azospirillum oleiclasticum]NYZ13380.1 hypothetical protein [Azospirillum oleiclasticum]NYZ20541.1 hypothetical protein [Azospirillum oleiclasticum]